VAGSVDGGTLIFDAGDLLLGSSCPPEDGGGCSMVVDDIDRYSIKTAPERCCACRWKPCPQPPDLPSERVDLRLMAWRPVAMPRI